MPEIVQRLTPTKETLIRLFALSGNICAFPECSHPLFDDELEFVAEICHIESAMPGGERFNENQTNEERRSFENLVGLCHLHHVKTNNELKYPTHVFKELKRKHESLNSATNNKFSVPDNVLELVYGILKKITEDLQTLKKDAKEIISTVNSTDGKVDQMFDLLKMHFGTSDPLEKEYERQLSEITKDIEAGLAQRALKQLFTLKDSIWANIKESLKFKILTNIGVCYHLLQEYEKTAEILIEAYSCQPGTPVSLSNIVNAYMAVHNYEQALVYLKIYKEKFPDSVTANGLWIKINSRDHAIHSLYDELPDSMKELPEIILSLGMAAKRQDDLPLALKYFTKAYELDKENDFTGNLLLQTHLEIYSRDFKLVNLKMISKETTEQLNFVLSLIHQLLVKIIDSELPKAKIALYMAEGYILGLLEKVPEAISAIDKGLALDPAHVFLLKHKGVLLTQIQKRAEAILVFLQIKDYTDVPDLPAVIAETYLRLGEPAKGSELLEDFIATAQPSYFKEQSVHILLDICIKAGFREKVENLKENTFTANTVLDKISSSRAERFLGNINEADQFLREAASLITEQSTFKEKFFLAEELATYKYYIDAIRLFEQIAVLDSLSEPTVKLSRLYHLIGENRKALDIAENLRKLYRPLHSVTEFEVDLYQMIGDQQNAKEIAEEFLVTFPENQEMRVTLAGIYLRLGLPEKAETLLNEGIDLSQLSDRLIKVYIAQLNLLGQKTKAYEIVYEYRRSNDTQNAHQLYVQTFLQFPIAKDAREKPPLVEFNCVVTLENSLKTTFVQVVEKRPDSDLRENEVNENHKRFPLLVGKKIGDSVDFDNAYRTWTVQNIDDKFIYAFKESQNKLDTIYSETSLFKSFHVDDFQAVLTKLGQSQQDWFADFQNAIKAYQLGALTFGHIAENFDKNPIELWGQMRAMKIGMRSADGVSATLINDLRATIKGKRLCADITALITFFELDLADELIAAFGKLLISNSTNDLVFDLRETSSHFRPDGLPSERANQLYLFTEKIAEYQIPDKLLTINALQKEASDLVLGKSFVDTMFLCLEQDGVLFSDDHLFRATVENEYQIKGLWSQGVLMYLLTENIITKEIYEQKVILLINLGIIHTSIDAEILYRSLVGFPGNPEGSFPNCLSILSGSMSTLQTASNVVYWFIFLLWQNNEFDDRYKKEVTREALMNLGINRNIYQVFTYFATFLEAMEITELSTQQVYVHQIIRQQVTEILDSFGIA